MLEVVDWSLGPVLVERTFTVLLTTLLSKRSMASHSADVSGGCGAGWVGGTGPWSWSSFSSDSVAFKACRLPYDSISA